MAISFDQATRELLDGKNFATIGTINPDGSPHTSVIWYRRENDTIVFSTTQDRRKARNIARDPRVSVSIFDLERPSHSVDLRGTAETTLDEERTLPDELAIRYLGEAVGFNDPDEVRLVVRVTPTKVTGFWG